MSIKFHGGTLSDTMAFLSSRWIPQTQKIMTENADQTSVVLQYQ